MQGGKLDELKGRVKEAVGALTGELQREGKVDQTTGKAKEATEDAIDKARDVIAGDEKRKK
jgi:uncharacterized protein YjbJ (UPF0337 family)